MTESWDKLRARAEQAQQMKNLAEAEQCWREALRHTEGFDRTDRRTALTLEGLSEVYWHLGRFDEATQCCKQLLGIYSELFGEDQFDVGVIANNLAMLLHVQQKYMEAEEYYQQALDIKTKRLGKDHPDVAKLLGNYSNLLRACNRPQDAEKLKAGEILITQRNWSKTNVDEPHNDSNGEGLLAQNSSSQNREPLPVAVARWESLRRMAEDAERERRYSDAEALWAAIVRYFEPFSNQDPRRISHALDSLADLLCLGNKHEMAEPFYRRAIEIKARFLGPSHIIVAKSLNNLARMYYQFSRFNDAEPLAKRCVEIYRGIYGEQHPDYATSLHNLGTLYHIQVRFADAEPLYRTALTIRQRTLGPDHPETTGLARSLANLLRSTGREAEARRIHGAGVAVITGTWRSLAVPEGEQLIPPGS